MSINTWYEKQKVVKMREMAYEEISKRNEKYKDLEFTITASVNWDLEEECFILIFWLRHKSIGEHYVAVKVFPYGAQEKLIRTINSEIIVSLSEAIDEKCFKVKGMFGTDVLEAVLTKKLTNTFQNDNHRYTIYEREGGIWSFNIELEELDE